MTASRVSGTCRLAVICCGCHPVAGLPSTAARGPAPGCADEAVAGWQRTRSLVGVRSGRRVGRVSVPPGATLRMVPPAVTGTAGPDWTDTVVVACPIATVNLVPCQAR